MTYTVAELKQAIRIALDQNMVSTQLVATDDIDTLSLEEIIESKIVDAARIVLRDAPAHLLDGGTVFPAASQVITWDSQAGYGPGSVVLPSDFLRLVCFKMSDWDHPVFVPIYEDDPLYAVQRSRFGGVRGNPQKPVVAIVMRSGALKLEFYSCAADSNASVAEAAYIKMPAIASDQISICEKLKPAVVYYAAYLTALAVGEADKASALLQTANTLMQ